VKLAILYDPGAPDWTSEDIAGVMRAVDEIADIFTAMGHQVQKVGVKHDLRWLQIAKRSDLVFNLCEGVHGVAVWEDHVVAMLEFEGVPFT